MNKFLKEIFHLLSINLHSYFQGQEKKLASFIKYYCILLALLLLWMIWHTVALWQAPKDIPTLFVFPTSMQHHIDLWKIPKLHLLGDYVLINPNNLPEANLNLKLIGTFVAKPENYSFAVIDSDNDDHKLYRQGDVIGGYIKIEKILPNKIVIKHNDQLEVIYLHKRNSIFSQENNQTEHNIFSDKSHAL